jgi:Ca-activated chloride channel family protein
LILTFRYLAFAALVFALARPQTAYQEIQRNIQGIDIILTMDVSQSMAIEDLAERARFDIARETMKEFVKQRTNDRIGFVVFSGEPFTLAPPTLDHDLLLESIDSARMGVLKDGTAIGDGLALAVNRLRNSKAKSRIIVLLTDGDSNVGQVSPATAGDLAAGYGIKVYTIAIGREGKVKLPIRHKNAFGQVVTSYQMFDNALNPELLKLIADKTGGKFYRVTEGSALESVFKEIDTFEKQDYLVREKTRYEEHFFWPLVIGFLLLLFEQVWAFAVVRFAT